ncbi:MAG TPA: hypothetical protein VHF89_03750 [Solirubrobacteraceae bacterium]|nr:hypothetical protein [Solirubrobacteraceae bacterium]
MRLRTLPLALLAAFALVAVAGAGTAAAKSCRSANYPGDGYFTSLSVRGTSCSAGRTVQRNHYRCRVRNGGKDGRCNRRVDGYRCSERRGESTPAEYNARVSCRKGSRRISFTYQQNI